MAMVVTVVMTMVAAMAMAVTAATVQPTVGVVELPYSQRRIDELRSAVENTFGPRWLGAARVTNLLQQAWQGRDPCFRVAHSRSSSESGGHPDVAPQWTGHPSTLYSRRVPQESRRVPPIKRLADGTIAEDRVEGDLYGFMKQLGAPLPVPQAAQ